MGYRHLRPVSRHLHLGIVVPGVIKTGCVLKHLVSKPAQLANDDLHLPVGPRMRSVALGIDDCVSGILECPRALQTTAYAINSVFGLREFKETASHLAIG